MNILDRAVLAKKLEERGFTNSGGVYTIQKKKIKIEVNLNTEFRVSLKILGLGYTKTYSTQLAVVLSGVDSALKSATNTKIYGYA